MSFWDIKRDEHTFSPTRDNHLEIPDISESDLKVILLNYEKYLYAAARQVSPDRSDEPLEIISCYATPKIDQMTETQRIYKLTINFKKLDDYRKLNFLLKMQNRYFGNENKSIIQQRQMFLKEIIFYSCLIPKMKDFMPWHHNELPVPDCFLAKCKEQEVYLGSTKTSPCCYLPGPVDILVLDDLKVGGYYPVTEEFSLAHVKLAVKSLAQLHAMSVVLNRRGISHNLSLTQAFPSLIQETVYTKYFNIEWHTKFTAAIEIFSVIGPLLRSDLLLSGKDISEVARMMINDLWSILEHASKPNSGHLHALCLMECDVNSFAFSCDEHESPRACKITAFQHIKYARPAVDLVQLLYNCTSYEIRSKNWKYLVDIYHEEFLEVINRSTLKYHPSLPMPVGLLSIAELHETYYECEIIGAARRAIDTSFACLLHYDPQMSDPQENLFHSAQKLLAYHRNQIPSRSELRRRAINAFNNDPRYKEEMYRNVGNILKCLARTVNCDPTQPHSICPHPNP